MNRKALEEILKKEYGISTVAELNKAIATAPKLNIGIMTKRGEDNGIQVARTART